MKRKFKNIAVLIKKARARKGISQVQIGQVLSPGARCAQFVSNIERGLCNLPWKHINKTCEALDIPKEDIITAMCDDHLINLQNQVYGEGV